MRLVVDTNILFTYFWEKTFCRDILDHEDIDFFSPILAIKEIDKHKEIIMGKAHISLMEFVAMRKDMAGQITFIDKRDCEKYYKNVKAHLRELGEDDKEKIMKDLDFLATAEMICCPLWSNDKLLKKQDEIIVLNTEELITLLDI
jgi:predicted nucleic acid-binding protein